MKRLARILLDYALARMVSRRVKVELGQESSVSWWALRNSRGGSISVGNGSMVSCRVDFDHPAGRVSIGDRCFIGTSHLVCHSRIDIADDVIISWDVTIVDHNSHALDWAGRASDVADWRRGVKRWDDVAIAPVRIERRVWIGFGASILKGVTIGEGAVIGAGSVVTRDVPPHTVVAGNPARVVKQLTPA